MSAGCVPHGCRRRAVGNVITRRAFSPQLTERTGPEAAGPRNDDTFHRGCGRIRERTPVDASCRREFVYRPADGDRSIDFADTALDSRWLRRSLRFYFRRGRLCVRRVAIAIYCLSRMALHAGRFYAVARSVVRSNYPFPGSCLASVIEMISREDGERHVNYFPYSARYARKLKACSNYQSWYYISFIYQS